MLLPRFVLRLAGLALIACTSGTFAAPPSEDGRLTQVEFLIQKGEYDRALQNVEEYLVANPKNARGRFLRAVVLSEQKKTQEAIKAYNDLIHERPDMPEPYNNLAVLHAALGQYEPARVALEMAIRTKPDYAVAHENLGDIYARLAAQSYEKAIQYDKNNQSAPLKLKQVTALLSPTRP